MMHPIIKKLQYKLQDDVLIVNAPPECRELLDNWKKTAKVHNGASARNSFSFALFFVKTVEDVRHVAKNYIGHLEPDAVSWMAYPKKTSKKYKSEITRDHGWEALGELGYEGVAMVSIDDDWSAFRFRKVDFIKTMQRRESLAMSQKGKERAKKK